MCQAGRPAGMHHGMAGTAEWAAATGRGAVPPGAGAAGATLAGVDAGPIPCSSPLAAKGASSTG